MRKANVLYRPAATLTLAVALPLMAVSCTPTVNVHVDPIYAQIDINIKVDRELDSFFQTVEQKTSGVSATTAPGAAPAPPAALPQTPPPLPPATQSAPPATQPATTVPATAPTQPQIMRSPSI